MSSKENKKMAQQRRAMEREKAVQRAKTRKILIGVAIVVAIALVIILPGMYGGEVDTEEEETEETTDVATETEEEDTDEAEATEDVAADEETADPELDTTEGREVQDGDTVNIDYTGYKDGEAFDGGSTNGAGADLTIGSHSYIDGFESGLIGKKVGETVDLNLTFPEDYGVEDLAGADVVFTVTINGIYNN